MKTIFTRKKSGASRSGSGGDDFQRGAVPVLGCINHSETTYHEAERVKVQFENEKAGRIFYRSLEQNAHSMPAPNP